MRNLEIKANELYSLLVETGLVKLKENEFIDGISAKQTAWPEDLYFVGVREKLDIGV